MTSQLECCYSVHDENRKQQQQQQEIVTYRSTHIHAHSHTHTAGKLLRCGIVYHAGES